MQCCGAVNEIFLRQKQNKTKQPPKKTLTDVEDKDKVEDRMGTVLIQDHTP